VLLDVVVAGRAQDRVQVGLVQCWNDDLCDEEAISCRAFLVIAVKVHTRERVFILSAWRCSEFQNRQAPMFPDRCGVVVIGRNEGKRLIACLTSVRSKTSDIVYVDSGSVDGSASEAERLGALVITLDPAQPFTAARARNEGFAALKKLNRDIRFVQFIDGDCILAPDWLESALAFIRHRNDVAIVCGRRKERYPLASVYNKLADLEWNTAIGEAVACGGDALVRVVAFESVGGFRQQLIAGEEPEMCIRLREIGWKIWRLDAEMTQHDIAMSRFGQWWYRRVRSGYGMAEVYWLHRHAHARIWGRETASAVIWGGVVPLVIALGALIHATLLAATLVYPLQIARIASRRGPCSLESWTFALFVMLGKFPEFQGFLKFCWQCWHGRKIGLIEYK
jgi:GT2 family glycosyltransferase